MTYKHLRRMVAYHQSQKDDLGVGWPTCTCKKDVEVWLEDQQIDGWTDREIMLWVDEHFK